MIEIIIVFRLSMVFLAILSLQFSVIPVMAQSTSTDAATFDENQQVFRDWQAVCYEDGSCTASVFAPQGATPDTADFIFRASRDAGNLTPLSLSFSAINKLPGNGEIINLRVIGGPAFALAQGAGYAVFDGGTEFFITDQKMLDTLYPAMQRGSTMSLSFRDGRGETHTAEFSLRGMSASVSWMNGVQKRKEKSTKVGPPPGANAKQEVGDALNIQPLALPPSVIALQSQVEACAGWAGRAEPQNLSRRYDLGENVNLYIVPCTPGNTNPASRIYIARKSGALDAQLFARFDNERGWTGTDRLANADFDKESGVLSSRFKTQGLDGCGILGVWMWRNGEFSMLRYAQWDDCENARAAEDWRVIYQPSVQ